MNEILSLIIFFPLLSALFSGIFRLHVKHLRIVAFGSSLAVLILTLILVYFFNPDAGMQFIHIAPWIQNYGITYYIGVDAISLVVLAMIAIIMPLLYLYIWNEQRHGYWYNMMLLNTGVMGAVLSLDLILFYLFWEVMLLPIFIMIGRYGNTNQQYNAMKLVIMTVFGSMAMLLSILYLGYSFFEAKGFWSFALYDIATLNLDLQTSIIVAAGFLLAFVIKIPLVGFHTWMAPAYASSPTPSVVILSSIMAKLGVYGIWRFGMGLFGDTLEYYINTLIVFTLIGVIYYAVHAIMENNLRRMFAYSSGSHLSLIALGLILANTYTWSGSLYLIATHALASAGIFIMIGLTYRRIASISISDLGGIASVAPKFAFFFSFFALSIAGLPGTGGFVAELLIIVGAFKHSMLIGIFTASTMVAAITFVFWMLQRTLFGPPNERTKNFVDLNANEMSILIPLVILLLITGVAPSLFTPLFEPTLQTMLLSMER
ncbi:MAG: NADH-quinone oxidoreductase subunit M [Campylobacterota bacterium]|nr:NADH-quinone oxidoreductase subunit M [Campylobacterota bacterium]